MRSELPPPALDLAVLEQAADWLLRLSESDDPAERAACQRWRDAAPAHALAWERAERLHSLLGTVPPELGRALFPPRRSLPRRQALKTLALLFATAPTASIGWQLWEHSRWSADERTVTGQRRQLHLPDGGSVVLDSATALDVQYDALVRQLHLREGRILIETGKDHAGRPFRVRTAHGTLLALGTRFEVSVIAARHRLRVLEGRVQITPALTEAATRFVEAGQGLWFDARGCDAPQALDASHVPWLNGMVAANAMPLADLLSELGRYRNGPLRCDPAIARLPVSGAFPLDDVSRSLAMLETTYPLRVQRALGGWWLTVAPRG